MQSKKADVKRKTQAFRFRELFNGGKMDKNKLRDDRQAELIFEDARSENRI